MPFSNRSQMTLEPAAAASAEMQRQNIESAHLLSGSARSRILAQLTRCEMEARARRSRLFKSSLFSDPAWDVLLDLFAAEFDGRRRFITSVALGAGVPRTTALRWICVLEEERLIRREPDPLDGRRTFIELTSDGLRTMTAYFGFDA